MASSPYLTEVLANALQGQNATSLNNEVGGNRGEIHALLAALLLIEEGVSGGAGALTEQTATLSNWLTAGTSVAAGATSVSVAVSADFAGTIAGGTIDPGLARSFSFEARSGGKLAAITITRSAGSFQIAKVV